ncbi:MAG TPA: SirB2 family protein [Candidatus Desulfobacillus sp.]|nr:SirB2 family protein [Candidatus Desulfobacillus sp.]
MSYQLLKHLHMTFVVISITGFFLRGIWMLADSPMLDRLWVRAVPHVNDTLLLLAAIFLAVRLRQYPFVDGWLTAKVLGLLAYILLGMFALRRGRSKAVRTAFWLAAMATFGYIVSVALTKDPRGFLALL